MTQPQTRLAIIGTGIAGMACAHYLKDRYEVHLFERNGYAGGHTNTVWVNEGDRRIPVDTGFMVYNKVTYPNMIRLFNDLGVETKATSMTFSVQHVPANIEYEGSGFSGLFAQIRNIVRPSHWKMLSEVLRFFREAPVVLEVEHPLHLATIDEYLASRKHSAIFRDRYLFPMAAAIWSTPHTGMGSYPIMTLVRFFKNHGLLGVNDHFEWRTVVDGSQQYREKILAPVKDRLRLDSPVASLARTGNGVSITFADGSTATFDHAIVAAHADEALAMLDEPTDAERELLGKFTYTDNHILLHSDPRAMPRSRRAWASWNYRVNTGDAGNYSASTVYWMNSLQQVSEHRDYFVTVNDPGLVAKDTIHFETRYTHPYFNRAAIEAQRDLPLLNADGPITYCGSYFRYGFHEDALFSALHVCERLSDGAISPL